jgi:hypothetical protein
MRWWWSSNRASTASDATIPGAMTTTRMPSGASSWASDSVTPLRASFEVL